MFFGGIFKMKLSEKEIEQIALGASLLGTGGGGDPHVGKLMALQAVKKTWACRTDKGGRCS